MDEDINNGLLFNYQYYIPSEILPLILSNVDVETLYKSCTLVCKQWNIIIKKFVCKIKCEQEFKKDDKYKNKLQWLRQEHYPYYVYQMISISNKSFYTNLIQNPCGVNVFNSWLMDSESRDNNFTVEDCTLFDKNICELNDELMSSNITKCFTIINSELSEKIQIIDLYKYRLTQQFIDEYQPPIYISEWYGCRRDNITCIYILYIILLDANYKEIKRCNCFYAFFRKSDRERFGSFHKVQHIFKDYGKNVRYVYFCSMGQGFTSHLEGWNGYCGTKFTNANVQVFYPNDAHLDKEIDEYPQESYHDRCKQHCKLLYMEYIPHYSKNKNLYKNIFLN